MTKQCYMTLIINNLFLYLVFCISLYFLSETYLFLYLIYYFLSPTNLFSQNIFFINLRYFSFAFRRFFKFFTVFLFSTANNFLEPNPMQLFCNSSMCAISLSNALLFSSSYSPPYAVLLQSAQP